MWISIPKNKNNNNRKNKTAGFTIVSLDESFFFYDSLVRRIWIVQDKIPIVRVTSSHQPSCIFGSIISEGKKTQKKQLRQCDVFNGYTFLDYIKKIHYKFSKCYLFMDKSTSHYTCKKVIFFYLKNRD
ncbi:MAG TPA: hypothetical protein VIY08_16430 [Candidatus Nitrosocosmicus sp.]